MDESAGEASNPASPGSPSSKGKVLIVDDEPDVLESTALVVEALGYDAIMVRDPDDILEAVLREEPGMILQDLKMPGLNVAGLVASLRLDPATAEVPLVFFSAGGDLPSTAARYDAWGFLAKPFGKPELSALLRSVLGPTPVSQKPPTLRDLQRDVGNTFHDYWNLLSALNSYILLLEDADRLDPESRRAVRGLGEIILKLESKTDRLRANITSFVRSLEESGAVAPEKSTRRRPERPVQDSGRLSRPPPLPPDLRGPSRRG